MLGHSLGTMEDIAIGDAIRNKVPNKSAVIFEIGVDCHYNYFKINRPEFTPYFKTENQIILQDGLCFVVDSVE